MKKENKLFTYAILIVVMIIPFMYSFFYLKAYWDPYGKGNIDNIPVAIINDDEGENGKKLIDSVKDSEKLKISVVSEDAAKDGLNSGKYYALIEIPSDFTSSMESAKDKDKKHATITYSPNQKSNYLASQIINSVVNAVEKNLDNQVNSEIINELSTKIEEVPSSLDTISDGFSKLNNGTKDLKNGTNKIYDGANSLATNTYKLNNGISSAYLGSKKIEDAINEKIKTYSSTNVLTEEQINEIKTKALDTVNASIDSNKISNLAWNTVSASLSNSNDTTVSNYAQQAGTEIMLAYFGTPQKLTQAVTCAKEYQAYQSIKENCVSYMSTYSVTPDVLTKDLNFISSVSTQLETLNIKTVNYVAQNVSKQVAISTAKTTAEQVTTQVSESVANQVANQVAIEVLNQIKTGVTELNAGLKTLNDGSNALASGANSLSTGAMTLNNGMSTLDNSVSTAKIELDDKICKTKDEVKSVETLAEYAKEPVKVDTKVVNEVPTYGTSFAPLFISIGLWVGALMFYVVLYYDKEKRFGFLGIDSNKYVKRTLGYHLIGTISGIFLAILLQLFLDLSITNIGLYYLSVVLIANTFIAIIEFLIANFGDIGKFVALIILVLQLAASGGTFPIETVTKCFRFLNPYLPMTYTIRLLKESLIAIDSSLLTNNLIIVSSMLVVLMTINIIMSIKRENKVK